ncbi:MAG: MFS transporter [Haloferacaceae archaeon]
MNRNDRRVVGLVMASHALVHTYELSVPILVSIWLTEFATTPARLGVVVTVGMGLFGLGALPGGVLSDLYGSQRLISACLAGMGLSFLVLGMAPGVPAVAVALVLWGVAASVYHPSGLSLISTGVTQRGRAFAYHGMAGNAGIAAGPLLTTLLLLAFDWRTVVQLLAAPAFVAFAASLVVDIEEGQAVADAGAAAADGDGASAADSATDADDRPSPPDSLGAFLSTSRTLFAGSFVLVFLIVMCSGLYYRGVLTFLPDLLAGLDAFSPVTVAGVQQQPTRYLYAGLLTVGVFGQYLGGRLTDRIAPERGIAVAFACLAVLAVGFLPVARLGVAPLLAVSALLGFLLFVVQPLYQATVAEYTPAEARGLSYGYTYLGVFGVGALGATVAGAVLTYASPMALFGVLAGFAAVAAALGAVLARR